MDRVAVPLWPFTLSGRLLIVALVGRYPTNKLISHEPISKRIATLPNHPCELLDTFGISFPFEKLSPT
jgi:hypothetical protein